MTYKPSAGSLCRIRRAMDVNQVQIEILAKQMSGWFTIIDSSGRGRIVEDMITLIGLFDKYGIEMPAICSIPNSYGEIIALCYHMSKS